MSSNFENLPLPVTKDSQDYVRIIPAGQTVEIPVVGDFIYCKFSDGEIRVVINGKSTNMEAGDERRSGEGTVFRGVNLINDTGVDKYVIFVIGFGGFDRKIVQGEITTVTGVRRANGRFVDDTRQTLSMSINPVYDYQGEQVEIGDFQASFNLGNDIPYRKFESFQYYNSDLYVKIQSFDSFKNGVYKITSGLGGLTKVTDNGGIFDNMRFLKIQKFTFAEGVVPGGLIFNTSDNGHENEIRYWDAPNNDYAVLGTAPYDVGGLYYNEEQGLLYVFVDRASQPCFVFEINGLSLVLKKEIDLSHIQSAGVVASSGTFNTKTQQWTLTNALADDSLNVAQVTKDFEIITVDNVNPGNENTSGSGSIRNTWIKIGESYYGWGLTDGLFYQASAIDMELTLRGFAAQTACDVSLINPSYDSFATRAVVAPDKDFGRLSVSGEIIKASLELYYRRFLAENYMDHVFDVTFFRPANGSVLQSLGGRSVTMQRLGIQDNFTVFMPSRIDITVDNDLPLI